MALADTIESLCGMKNWRFGDGNEITRETVDLAKQFGAVIAGRLPADAFPTISGAVVVVAYPPNSRTAIETHVLAGQRIGLAFDTDNDWIDLGESAIEEAKSKLDLLVSLACGGTKERCDDG